MVPTLLEQGEMVPCIVREPRKLEARSWHNDPGVQFMRGDLDDIEELSVQLRDCRVAYYFIHSMVISGKDYVERDEYLAENFAQAAAQAGVKRIIYLGGLGELGDGLSEHLQSRRDVERTLGSMGIAVTTLRAAMMIGAGSASFEILCYLVERLPVMITPRWVQTESQPVAISDVLY